MLRHVLAPINPDAARALSLPRTLSDAAGVAVTFDDGPHPEGTPAVLEVLAMSDAIRRLVLNHAEAREIHGVAVEEGMRTMYQDGLLKALDGDTTIEEVLRVTRDV